ncbi:mannonate dehydratase [uncultured Chryseobacterium sp.]|uniref:mannonate dehydratase n=1 Tax=uncultured Chryseobacterium sp. TaxID=259322 RepID=UPI0037491038
MEKTWRWFGKKDKIQLNMLRQIGVEGIVSALHDVPNGQVWTLEAIQEYKQYIESHGLRWSVVESLPVSEAIKYGGEDRDSLIENYILSLVNLGKAGVKTVCYNFMPVLDWARTDLFHEWEDGSSSLYFDKARFAYFEIHILKRQGAENDYQPEILQKVEELKTTLSEEDNNDLIDSVIVKTQGFVNGNIKEGELNPVEKFNNLLALYDGVDKNQLRENMKYFLEKIMPVCEKWDIQMCVHPDDPPYSLLGLPRIVTNEEDINWFLNAVDNPHNGLTFCAGSLSANLQNDVPALAQKFASRTRFVHLRSTNVFENGDFIEAHHLGGRGKLIEVVRVFEKEKPELPMRIDHGRLLTDDIGKGYNPGYSFLGRMLALGQIEGVMAAVQNEMAGKN